jgi:putative CocE/NonD family hydrolase
MELPEDTGDLDEMWRRFMSPVTRLRHITPPGAAHQQEQPGLIAARPPYPRLADRPDVLVFQTEPLAGAVEVTGPILVRLWISSSAVDTDFTAKLIDVYPPNLDYPDGYHMNLVDSIIRCRYRDSWEREMLLEPGQVYPVQIKLAPTSNLFQAGHRIRLDISSSNFPRLDVNPNSGEPIGRHTRTVIAHNTVYLDHRRPSHVILPIIPG